MRKDSSTGLVFRIAPSNDLAEMWRTRRLSLSADIRGISVRTLACDQRQSHRVTALPQCSRSQGFSQVFSHVTEGDLVAQRLCHAVHIHMVSFQYVKLHVFEEWTEAHSKSWSWAEAPDKTSIPR